MQLELGKFYKNYMGQKIGPILAYNDWTLGKASWSDGTWTYRDDGSWAGSVSGPDKLDLIAEWRDEPKSPIQEVVVTKRKLVPGEYGNLSIYESQGDLRIEFNKSKHTAEELEEAAHILAQLAEFLRSEEGK